MKKNIENELLRSWIAPAEDMGAAAIYFYKDVDLGGHTASKATLYVCGIGYHHVKVNGEDTTDHRLAPMHSSYHKRCYYEEIDVTSKFVSGKNEIEISVGQGWRRVYSPVYSQLKERKIEFFGIPQLTAVLVITFADGEEMTIVTDADWRCGGGNITYSDLYMGEVYDARVVPARDHGCIRVPAPSEDTRMCLTELEPIKIMRVLEPVSIHKVSDGYVFDMGETIAGVCEIDIPKDMAVGDELIIGHAELLDNDGDLNVAALRGAKSTDKYIAGETNLDKWSPRFTYHGFRYVKVKGLKCRPTRNILRGLQMYNDIDSGSVFACGSPIVNEIHRMAVRTERDNIHGIATDCPQRDERMGWMNDATVRFTAMPYNFNVSKLFPKIIRDIIDTQKNGAITCTAPYIFGGQPADPVCSSFLIAGYESYMYYGNTDIIKEAYPNFRAWNECLGRYVKDGILEHTIWGDWAGPQYACIGNDPKSAVTPGQFMSTGFYYYNSKLLAFFAGVLGYDDEKVAHEKKAEETRKAMLDKWVSDDGRVCTASMACQAFSLWLGILPEDIRPKAAKLMNDMVVESGYMITTGNLCTLYLMEMLAEYGYIDTAWEIITREEYPSWGYMLQNGASTVWERFELKKDPAMNSHCHPMYGSIEKWIYSRLAGVKPLEEGFKKALIHPYIPKKLLSARAVVATVYGDILVRWERNYGEAKLLVDIPEGMTATVCFGGESYEVGDGTHVFKYDDPDCIPNY